MKPLCRIQLKPGHLYVDRLSGLRVLVVAEEHTGPDPEDPRRQKMTTLLYGLYYNPVYGTHARMQLHDHLLEPLHMPSEPGR